MQRSSRTRRKRDEKKKNVHPRKTAWRTAGWRGFAGCNAPRKYCALQRRRCRGNGILMSDLEMDTSGRRTEGRRRKKPRRYIARFISIQSLSCGSRRFAVFVERPRNCVASGTQLYTIHAGDRGGEESREKRMGSRRWEREREKESERGTRKRRVRGRELHGRVARVSARPVTSAPSSSPLRVSRTHGSMC